MKEHLGISKPKKHRTTLGWYKIGMVRDWDGALAIIMSKQKMML